MSDANSFGCRNIFTEHKIVVETEHKGWLHVDLKQDYLWRNGLMQERHNSSALAMELRLSCTNPSISKFLA